MDWTEKYYRTVKDYRTMLRGFWVGFNARMVKLESHEGSKFYDEEKKKAEQERDAGILAEKKNAANRFNECLNAMRENALSMKMVAPTAEQLALLQLLQMREHLTKTDIELAANSLRECPAACDVLRELAKKHQIVGAVIRDNAGESPEAILDHITSLKDSADKLLRLNKPDSRRERKLNTGDPIEDLKQAQLFHIDVEVNNKEDAMSFFGMVKDYESFAKAVNDQ